jgi:geranylgeranyl pyrophosphate synthase
MDAVNSYYTTACAGQHLDLSLTPEEAVSEDVYLKVTAMKSASAVECACYVGALLAKANQGLTDRFAMFGHNLGMAAQIANDIRGVTRRSDIAKRKITLPAIYALAQTDGETRSLLETVFCKRTSEFTPASDQIRELLFRTGAVQYATIKIELYKQRAMDTLSEIEREGAKVEQLKQFLE